MYCALYLSHFFSNDYSLPAKKEASNFIFLEIQLEYKISTSQNKKF